VELSGRIPSHLKMSIRKSKRFMKQAAAAYLPQDIINRPKHGFGSPIDKWLRHDLKEMTGDILSPDNIRKAGYFNSDYVSAMLNDHFSGKANNGERLFMLMVFQMWRDAFFR
jgi:asparagine synthase (glutamine-hydrolysing)